MSCSCMVTPKATSLKRLIGEALTEKGDNEVVEGKLKKKDKEKN